MQRGLLGSPRLTTALEITSHYAAAHGIEVRHPFLDRRLIELCLALPSRLSLRDGWTRYILRAALADVLPSEVANRAGKAWMTDTFARSLFERDGNLLSNALQDLGVLDRYVAVDDISEKVRNGRSLPNDEQARLARLATLSIWLNMRHRFSSESGATRHEQCKDAAKAIDSPQDQRSEHYGEIIADKESVQLTEAINVVA
jgi:asparagine synthetase B (glutamine-hydrolysing)